LDSGKGPLSCRRGRARFAIFSNPPAATAPNTLTKTPAKLILLGEMLICRASTKSNYQTAPAAHLVVIGVCALIGFCELLILTNDGMGLGPDSAKYIGAARYLLEHGSLCIPFGENTPVPMTHYPPFYPLMLATGGVLGVDPLFAARGLNLLLFAANIALIGIAFTKISRNLLPVALGTFLFATSPQMLRIHATVWSEAPFLFFMLVSFISLMEYSGKGDWRMLICAAIATALAALTRYAGAALVAGALLAIFTRRQSSLRTKVAHVFLFGAIACLPVSLWIVRNLLLAGTAFNRTIVFHPITRPRLEQALDTLSQWILPSKLPYQFRLVGLFLVAIALALLMRRRKNRGHTNFGTALQPLFCFAGCYVLMLVASLSFIGAHTPLDFRILSPLFIVFLIVLMFMLDVGLPLLHGRKKAAVLLLCLIIAASYALRAVKLMSDEKRRWACYGSVEWRHSPTIANIKTLPAQTLIFSNSPDAIYLLTGRSTLRIPQEINPDTTLVNDEFTEQVQQMAELLRSQRGILIYLRRVNWRWYLPSEEKLRKLLPLQLVSEKGDGAIYTCR